MTWLELGLSAVALFTLVVLILIILGAMDTITIG